MDVCDEASEVNDLSKPKWREWMQVFTEGKKVSEINLVIQEDEGNQNKDSMSQLNSNTMDPAKLLSEVKTESIYEEFMQYVAMSGPLNLRLIAPEQWHKLSEIASNQSGLGTPRDLHFLNQLYIPSNKELG